MKQDEEVRMETFGGWLHEQRSLRRLTREEFAKRIGCSVSALRKIENGQRRPSVQIAELMANCLDIPLEERSTFVRVARGELSVDRLHPKAQVAIHTNVSSPKANLPIFPTPLIGREREVQQLSQLLCDPQCRLLTLVGPGGIGKTRLAVEAASHMEHVSADGVYFIPLTPVNNTRFIVPVIADSIGFAFQSTSHANPKIQLFGYLKEKQVLLLTDNLEQLLSEPGIEVLTELLAHAPQVKLLATSRESLGLQGEWVFEVHGLPIPEIGLTEETLQETSVELFLQRARRAHVGFNATAEDYPAIVHISQLVEGNPLGIELAAAWVRTLSCDEIEREIERGLDFLSISARDIPVRHRSMRAVFDYSWKLLTEEEQRVLLRLSVFRGGFRRDAAEEVAGVTLPVLSALVTKSLVRRSGTGRYDLHELIRQFAAEQFAERPDEQAATQEHHARYYLTYFSQADERLQSGAQLEALVELTDEMDNFRAAWDWAVSHGELALIEQTARTLAMFYDTRGWLQEGLDTLGSAVGALEVAYRQSPPDMTNQVTLGRILAFRSVLASRLGQYEQAQAMLERSLEILRPLNEPPALVEAITYLGIDMELTSNYARALELYSEGVEMTTSFRGRWGAGLCLTCVIDQIGTAQAMAKPEDRHERLQAAVADWRIVGDSRFTAFGQNLLSWSALALGRYGEARAALEESVSLSISVGDRWGLGLAYRGLGIVAQTQGEYSQAVDMFRKSLEILIELGARQDAARVLAEMGRSVFALGNEAEAGRVWREALCLAFETRGTFIALEALVGMASLQAKQGDLEHALELLWIVLNHPASLQETKDRADHLRAELETQLTRAQVEEIQAHAGEKTFDVVVGDLLN